MKLTAYMTLTAYTLEIIQTTALLRLARLLGRDEDT